MIGFIHLYYLRSKKWYEGPNVCVERKVIQDGDEVEGN